MLPGVARKHSQSAYAVLQKSLQQEWAFMQWVAPEIRDAFGFAEQDLRDTCIPDIFQRLGEGTFGRRVTLISLKQAGLVLPDPMQTAPENWTASCVIKGHLVTVPGGQE